MNRLSKLFADDGTVLSAWTGSQSPAYCSMLAQLGFDAVAFDCQHNMASESGVLNAIPSITDRGLPAIVRIPVDRLEATSKMLDAGAHMVIAPMINTVEDAKKLAGYAKYPPHGERSYGVAYVSGLLGTDIGTYAESAGSETYCIAMVETLQAYEALDDILAVDGIDGVFCGPSDLSISIANKPTPTPFGESSIKQVRDIAERTRAAGKLACTYCANAKTANLAHEMGYRFIALASDMGYLRQGVDNLLGEMSFR